MLPNTRVERVADRVVEADDGEPAEVTALGPGAGATAEPATLATEDLSVEETRPVATLPPVVAVLPAVAAGRAGTRLLAALVVVAVVAGAVPAAGSAAPWLLAALSLGVASAACAPCVALAARALTIA
jgi:hypothetical protein